MFFIHQEKRSQECKALDIGNWQISRVHYVVRYLGILLDDQLSWKVHINHLCGNLTKILSAFKLIKRPISDKFKRDLCYAYCFSHITCEIQLYRTAANTSIHKLQVL